MFRRLRRLKKHALEWALTEARLPPGAVVECGVYRGKTITRIAEALPDREVYGFDCFTGLPRDWREGYPRGAFDCGGALPRVPGNVRLVPGEFGATLPGFARDAAARGAKIALLHVDCDLYESAAAVLAELGPLLQPGAAIVFDELINYPGYREHEWKAVEEFLARGAVEVAWAGCSSRFVERPTDRTVACQAVACVVTRAGAELARFS